MYQTPKPAAKQLSIRLLANGDLDFAIQLREIAGWNQTQRDWQRLLEHEPSGCFMALWDGEPAGTVTTTTYGRELAWIGMMLVHPGFRRRGIASALMQQALSYLKGLGTRCIKLDATPAGGPIYLRLGFRPEWDFYRWERTTTDGFADASVAAKRNISSGWDGVELAIRLNKIREIDVQAFGADRLQWLRGLGGVSDVVLTEDGCGMMRGGEVASYLGPVVARDVLSAERIIRELCGRTAGPIFWDVPGPNQSAVQLARSLGFQPTRKLLRMWTGESLAAGQVEWQFAIGGPETG